MTSRSLKRIYVAANINSVPPTHNQFTAAKRKLDTADQDEVFFLKNKKENRNFCCLIYKLTLYMCIEIIKAYAIHS